MLTTGLLVLILGGVPRYQPITIQSQSYIISSGYQQYARVAAAPYDYYESFKSPYRDSVYNQYYNPDNPYNSYWDHRNYSRLVPGTTHGYRPR